MPPVGFHALNAGGVQVRGLPSDLLVNPRSLRIEHCSVGININPVQSNLREIFCEICNVRSMAGGNLRKKFKLEPNEKKITSKAAIGVSGISVRRTLRIGSWKTKRIWRVKERGGHLVPIRCRGAVGLRTSPAHP